MATSLNATIDWSSSTVSSTTGDSTRDVVAPLPPGTVVPPAATRIPIAQASALTPVVMGAGGATMNPSIAANRGASMHAAQPSQPTSNAEGLPIIDGYDLIRAAGKGGMGVVYEAIQLATGRRVAIKLLPEAALASDLARTRFAREVEVVARLQHSGIVPILDSGVRKGLYFYAMDFVEGESLDVVIPPGKGEPRKVALMLVEICDSVDYAHQRGVLHRDIKPSNVLVDKQSKTHLLDFGLAKQTSDGESPVQTGVTISGAGQLLGTVAFMSPEQASGNADQASVRSDVYSLGVMAYLMLTGKLPVSMNGSLREVLTWIADREPTAPSRIRPLLGKDIDAILLKALEKVPERRYATAGELAADLRRWLADEAILARPISTYERGARWVRKNKALAATIAVATMTLIVVSTTLITRVVQERNRANAASIESQKNEKLAEQRAKDAMAALAEANERKKEAEDVSLFGASIIDAPGLMKNLNITLLEILDQATKRIDATPPESARAEVRSRELLARVYQKVGRFPQVEHHLQRVLELRQANKLPGADAEPALADTLHNFAASLWWQRKYEEAQPLYLRSLAIRRRLFTGDSPEVAISLMHLGACKLSLGKLEEAHMLYVDALAMRQRIFGPENEMVASALNNLSKSYAEREDYTKAEELSRRALDMITKIKGPTDINTASASQNLALTLLEKGDFTAAKEAFGRALSIRRENYPLGHPVTANSLVGLARAKLQLGETADALALSQEALDLYERIKHDQPVDLADARATVGEAMLAIGRSDDALMVLRQAMDSLESARNPPKLTLAALLVDLGEVYCSLQRSEEARSNLQQAVEIARQARGPGSKFATSIQDRVAKVPCAGDIK